MATGAQPERARMSTLLRVLADAEIARTHEESLAALARTGMRIDSANARRILGEAGARVDEAERRVRFPRELVEAALAAAPKRFALGGRRPGYTLEMNAGACTLMPDGESTTVFDPVENLRRAPTWDDWANATKLVDTMDEVGLYWRMVNSGVEGGGGPGPAVAHWRNTFSLFGKHVQDEIATEQDARWLLELLVTIFGSKEAVVRDHPFSVLFCPVSPLAMEGEHTDAWLATAGWDIPIAIMPMPMMGTSAPTGLRSTIVSGNAEVLGAIVLAQAAHEGTPVIYAPALAAMEPRTGRWAGGGPEHSLLGAATTEMGRFYGLPVTASTGGTDHFAPGAQAAYERTLNWSLPVLSWPDILIGPGSLGGASTLCLEQMVMDVEVYRMCRRLHEGIGAGTGETDVLAALEEVGPVGDFLARTQTRDAVRGGEWFMPRIGHHSTYDRWEAVGRPDVVGHAREVAMAAIAGHVPLPFDDGVEDELVRLERAARGS
ncbi:MAG TPA: trimethylamine methyltransferase family protein [Candidatus Limnocylindrales bacterium]|nr:trimethylamine methyltransferase family protein [Candidatus Limnocylindrales bacterium]